MTLADPSPWLAVLGRAHPVLLHAPLGILPAIALLEFGSALLRRPPPRGSVLALAWFGAATAAAAVASGLVLAGEGGHANELLGNHKILGIVLGGLCVLTAVLAFFEQRLPMRLSLLAALGVMIPTGHLGGTMTHGKDFLFAPFRELDEAPPPTTVFARTIQPILERTCTKCHNPEKLKGELLLTTPDGIRKGGENGPVVVAGKPEDSPLLVRCLLPADHDDHMPPEGKAQPTEAELAALRAWIAAGAAF